MLRLPRTVFRLELQKRQETAFQLAPRAQAASQVPQQLQEPLLAAEAEPDGSQLALALGVALAQQELCQTTTQCAGRALPVS